MKSFCLVRAAFITAARIVLCIVGLALALLSSSARADDLTAELNQNQANRLSIFHDYSISAIGTTPGNIPGSSGTGLATPLFGKFASTDNNVSNRDWSVSATPLFGYDSNPEARSSAQDSLYTGLDANAIYYLQLDPNDKSWGGPTDFLFSMDVNGALYEGNVKQANVLQTTATGSLKHVFSNTVTTSLLLQDQYTVEHGYSFLNTFDVAPSMELFWLPRLSTELEYDFTRLDYFFKPTPNPQDPTASRNTLSAYFHFYSKPQYGPMGPSPDRLTDILRTLLDRATLGYAYVWNKADASGGDYDYEGNRFIFALRDLRPLKTPALSFDLQYAYELDKYKNISTFTSQVVSIPRGIRRSDNLDIFTLRANARLLDFSHNRGTLGSFFQWDVIYDNSNVPVRDFNEFLVSAGFTYQY
jgi:hypothetical protein